MMKKTVFLLVAWSIFCGLGHTAIAQTITLGYFDFPPYEFEENGQPTGVLVRIVETIFEKADIPLELEFLPFKRAYETTKTGRIDGVFNFYKIEERQTFFDYSEALIKNPLVFFVPKDSGITFNTLEDLQGLRIGVLRGFTYGADFDQSPLFTRDATHSHELNFRKLMAGRIDVYPCDKLVGIHVATQHNLLSAFKILPTPLRVMDGYIGFTKGTHQDVIQKINTIILEMHQNGEIETMIADYIRTSG